MNRCVKSGWSESEKAKFKYKMIFSDDQVDHLVSLEPDSDSENERDDGREAQYKNQMDKLELSEDIYVVGFLEFLLNDSAMIANRVVFKCIFAFGLQMSLITLLLY